MTIKEVSQKYNISQDTLRYYEKVKMIPRVNRKENGIRDYNEKDLSWIELALCMRSSGLSVEAISKYLFLYQKGDETIFERMELLENQMSLLKEQKKKLDETMKKLSFKISMYKEKIKK